MPRFKKRFLKIFALSIASLLLLLGIAASLVLKIVLPREVEKRLALVSERTGIEIEVESMRFDLLRGLEARDVRMSDIIKLTDPFITVRNFVVSPDIISSLLTASVKIKARVVGPTIELSEETLYKLRGLVGGTVETGDARRGREGGMGDLVSVVLERVEVVDAVVNTPWTGPFDLSWMELRRVSDAEGTKTLIDVRGKVSEGEFTGRIVVNAEGVEPWISTDLTYENGRLALGRATAYIGTLAVKYTAARARADNEPFAGVAEASLSGLTLMGEAYLLSSYGGAASLAHAGETIIVDGELVDSDGAGAIGFSAEYDGGLIVKVPRFALEAAEGLLTPFLPGAFGSADLSGRAELTLETDEAGGMSGRVVFEDAGLELSGSELAVRGLEGTIDIVETAGGTRALADYGADRKSFKRLERAGVFEGTRGEPGGISASEVRYGFLTLEDLQCSIEASRDTLSFSALSAGFIDGELIGEGEVGLGKSPGAFEVTLFLRDGSLAGLTRRAGMEDYITGRIDSMAALSGVSGEFATYDGDFSIWSIRSKEPRRIGRALLKNLGMSEKVLLGKYRKYDSGRVSGKVRRGLLTFKEFSITNRTLFMTDFRVQADEKMNSIGIDHLLNVINETTRRISQGGLDIEIEK